MSKIMFLTQNGKMEKLIKNRNLANIIHNVDPLIHKEMLVSIFRDNLYEDEWNTESIVNLVFHLMHFIPAKKKMNFSYIYEETAYYCYKKQFTFFVE